VLGRDAAYRVFPHPPTAPPHLARVHSRAMGLARPVIVLALDVVLVALFTLLLLVIRPTLHL
jgi:hypothetical protein